MYDIPSGFTGFTIDVFGGSVSDSEGDVTKALFAITYQERVNDVDFKITDGPDDWSAMTPTGEFVGLSNPKVMFSNRDSAIVQFDMESKYPSNSSLDLCYRGDGAKFTVEELDTINKPFVPNTIIGALGFTSNEYGGATDDQGQVARILFNISFANRRNEVEFTISEDPDDWAVLMGDGSYINLKNPNVLFQNRDGATIVFQMSNVYPASAPGFLVRRRESAIYTITEIDEDHPFVPVQQLVFPTYLPAGERINLHTQVVVYPMNSTLRGINWSLVSPGSTNAEISNGWISTVNPGKIILRATIPSGLGLGSDFKQDIEVLVIENWITIEDQPHLDTAVIAGEINEELTVIASTIVGELSYQWYRNAVPDNESGTAIAGAQSATYKIPKGLVPGQYYYFCEIRKVNFPSMRTDVATVRVRDKLVSLDIYPPMASIPPGTSQQFAVTRNPQTSDELAIVTWHSNNHHIITIDQYGVATAHNPGVATISANIGGVYASIEANTIYTPVSGINFSFGKILETGTTYNLPTKVEPANASNQKIEWAIVSAGTTGTTITNSPNAKIVPNGVGTLVLRATIKKGSTPTTDFVREFTFSVIKGHVPVTAITMQDIGQPRVGAVYTLKGTASPSTASNTVVNWRVANAGNTGAKIAAGDILTFTGTGNCVIQAVVKNGLSKNTDFTKDFPLTVKPKFIAVQRIDDFPESLPYHAGETDGYTFTAKVFPTNADHRQIIYSVSDRDRSNLTPKIVGNVLTFDNSSMNDKSEIGIVVKMVVKEGLSEGVDFITESVIAITPPPADDVRIPVERATWRLPSVLRAFRPIKIDETELVPDRCDAKLIHWDVKRNKDIGGCSAIIFDNRVETHDDLQANGVHFEDSQYGWTDPATDSYKSPKNYIYPMSKGELKVSMSVPDGISINVPFEESRVLNILDPFIPVKDILNVPESINMGSKFLLSAEIDTGDGMNDQTAEWDDRVSTYSEMQYRITAGPNVATIDANGVITPKTTGTFKLRITVPSGVQEAYTWHRLSADPDEDPVVFQKKDFTKDFTIQVVSAEDAKTRIMTIKKKGSSGLTEEVHIYKKADFDLLRSIGDPEGTIPLKGVNTKRSAITEVYFYDEFKYTDLSNFGRNFTNLTKINRIPASAKKLRNFLMGCTKFNQRITIPKGVTGARCLEGFLRDCTSFNQRIIIPAGVKGEKCLESFLRGCTSFNRAIALPEELSGDCCMYSFMMGCTSFNSNIILPKKISGKRCMENVLRDCQNFNKPVILPEAISGRYNMAAFMFNCNRMDSPVVVPTAATAEGSEHDVITLSTFYRNANIATKGVDIRGDGAVAWATKTGPQPPAPDPDDPHPQDPDLLPLRTLKCTGLDVPTVKPEDPMVSVEVYNNATPNGVYKDFIVGNRVKYTVTVANNSETSITGVKLNDTIPEEIDYVSAACDTAGINIVETRDPVMRKLTVMGYESTDGDRYVEKEVEVGSTVTISAGTPKEAGETFSAWYFSRTINEKASSKDETFTFTMPNKNIIIKAVLDVADSHSITVVDTFDNDVYGGNYIAGDTVTITAGQRPGFKFTGWEVTTGTIKIDDYNANTTTFEVPETAGGTIVANWQDIDISDVNPEDELGKVTSFAATIGSMTAGQQVVFTVETKAAALGTDVSSTATVTFDQSSKQEDLTTTTAVALIDIVQNSESVD